ncbi:NERD domain-containing protein [Litorivicinus sp.]|nr:NERD domain-containing protein [Litorivicinus sp.]
MARLIPKVRVDEIAHKSERDTAKYLVEKLPDDCIVYHSYPWLRIDRNDKGYKTLREGETDFVIIIPTHGVLILEVKGGVIEYDDSSRQWSRNNGRNLKPIQDPFEQANRNTHYLENEIKIRGYQGASALPFTYGYAVVFPDCEYTGSPPPGSQPSIIFSASDLPLIDRKIYTVLNQWTRANSPRKLTTNDVGKIQKAISPGFNLLPALFRSIEAQEEKLFRLTTDQMSMLVFLGTTSRACIEGVAGSGKTMLAQARAEKFADEGRSTLLVCYNKTLAKWISDSLADEYEELITVKHFHGLCADWVRESGQPFAPPKQDASAFWQEQAPEMLMDAIDLVEEKFDAVIVDEGQDFYPNWWLPLESINAHGDEGAMYVFYDPRQNLYVNQKGSVPALEGPFILPTNCRNTRAIARKCGEILDLNIPTREGAPEGKPPEIFTLEMSFDVKKHVERFVHEWITKGKLKTDQLAILCPTKKDKSSLANTNAVRGIQLTDDINVWKAREGILFSTVKNFKGLEADAVILIDSPSEEEAPYFNKSDYYVACSRAKHLLVVLHKEK